MLCRPPAGPAGGYMSCGRPRRTVAAVPGGGVGPRWGGRRLFRGHVPLAVSYAARRLRVPGRDLSAYLSKPRPALVPMIFFHKE